MPYRTDRRWPELRSLSTGSRIPKGPPRLEGAPGDPIFDSPRSPDPRDSSCGARPETGDAGVGPEARAVHSSSAREATHVVGRIRASAAPCRNRQAECRSAPAAMRTRSRGLRLQCGDDGERIIGAPGTSVGSNQESHESRCGGGSRLRTQRHLDLARDGPVRAFPPARFSGASRWYRRARAAPCLPRRDASAAEGGCSNPALKPIWLAA